MSSSTALDGDGRCLDSPTVWIVCGEESGDQLGAKLMRALKARLGADRLRFGGVGGQAMANEGLNSLFLA